MMNYYQHEKQVAKFLKDAEKKDRYDSVSAKASVTPKTRIVAEGQPCRHCEMPVVRESHDQPPKYKAGGYWFEWRP